MGTDPRLGLFLGVNPPEELGTLCRELAHWVAVGDGRDGEYDVFLWRPADPSHPGSHPFVLWADDRRAVTSHGERALLILTADPDVAEFAVGKQLPTRQVPKVRDTGRQALPVAPFVRSRIRVARGLPERILVDHRQTWTWAGHPVDGDLADTVVALASAVTVTDPSEAVRALAWQTPVVTSPPCAELLALNHDEQCLVAPSAAERLEAASQLANDQRMATRLSWKGRLLYESRHSWQICTEEVLGSIGVLGTWSPSSLMVRLGELGTPPSASVVRRVAAAVAPVVNPSLVPVGEMS
jgi:hypothetical protein